MTRHNTFRTMIEVTAGMVNRRPLTKSTLDDPRDLSVQTPALFIAPGILMNSLTALLPPRPVGGSSLQSAAELEKVRDPGILDPRKYFGFMNWQKIFEINSRAFNAI